jgi:bifunctional DNA-binding transcriptional regulator/antitoxin component of YhaV-PrlF toxin-antitoxin module
MDREFEATFDSQGHLDIPRDVRERHGFRNGAKVTIEDREEEVVIKPIEKPRKSRSMSDMAGFLGPNSKALDILMEERRKDREKEDRPFGT